MMFTADGKRQRLPLIFYSFVVEIEKCLLLFTANTNILIQLYRELKADDRRQKFIFAVCRLPFAVNVMLNIANDEIKI